MNLSYIFLFLSVAIGAIIVEIFKPNKGKNIQLLLTFSGAYLLAVSTLHLIPELFENNPSEKIGIFIFRIFKMVARRSKYDFWIPDKILSWNIYF